MKNTKLILGTLAKRELTGEKVCIINSGGNVQYYVKPILDDYSNSDDVNYAGYLSSICDRDIFDPGAGKDMDDRKNEVIGQLEDYFFIIDELKSSGLFTNIGNTYNRADIVNFHTAMMCGNLVVLSGLSGTGKSSLVRIYSEALGINEHEGFLSIPVRPSWNDDADILGFPDMMHHVYKPAENGFTDFLINAARPENSGKLYIVCFDEMNLARVEHYFSQFLSVLECPEGQRVLRLYDKKMESELTNSNDYPAEILLGNNIRFVGTVNSDESTHHFSDKVLDRADVIELEIVDYSAAYNSYVKYAPLDTVVTADKYAKMVRQPAMEKMPEVAKLLWDIHTLLRTSGTGLGVGPRIVGSIRKYLNNIPAGEKTVYTYSRALDDQIVQRVLTKIHGPENQMRAIFDEENELNIVSIFDKYFEYSDFKHSRQVVEKKKKELEDYGYCI